MILKARYILPATGTYAKSHICRLMNVWSAGIWYHWVMDSLWETTCNSGQEGTKFCVYISTHLVNFPRKLDIQLCIIQQYHSQKLINCILASYQYVSTFSYNIFMSSWNHMEFEVNCRSISWSTETSRVTGLRMPVFLYQWPSLSRLYLYSKYRNLPDDKKVMIIFRKKKHKIQRICKYEQLRYTWDRFHAWSKPIEHCIYYYLNTFTLHLWNT